jgi:hypothetical protein
LVAVTILASFFTAAAAASWALPSPPPAPAAKFQLTMRAKAETRATYVHAVEKTNEQAKPFAAAPARGVDGGMAAASFFFLLGLAASHRAGTARGARTKKSA